MPAVAITRLSADLALSNTMQLSGQITYNQLREVVQIEGFSSSGGRRAA